MSPPRAARLPRPHPLLAPAPVLCVPQLEGAEEERARCLLAPPAAHLACPPPPPHPALGSDSPAAAALLTAAALAIPRTQRPPPFVAVFVCRRWQAPSGSTRIKKRAASRAANHLLPAPATVQHPAGSLSGARSTSSFTGWRTPHRSWRGGGFPGFWLRCLDRLGPLVTDLDPGPKPNTQQSVDPICCQKQ